MIDLTSIFIWAFVITGVIMMGVYLLLKFDWFAKKILGGLFDALNSDKDPDK